jgi:hypothetical protein
MSHLGLGRAKTSAVAPHIEIIPEQLHLWGSNHTAHARFDALLENCVFYISRMYEFLHSQGHSRHFGDVRDESAHPPIADVVLQRRKWSKRANNGSAFNHLCACE